MNVKLDIGHYSFHIFTLITGFYFLFNIFYLLLILHQIYHYELTNTFFCNYDFF